MKTNTVKEKRLKKKLIRLVRKYDPDLVSSVKRLIFDMERMKQIRQQGFDPSEYYG